MRYQTPQFIEEDEKLFGPLTFRQFVYLVGGFGISFILYRSLPFLIGVVAVVPVAMLSLALAFYKVNDRPFIDTVEAAFFYVFSRRLYTYKKIDKPMQQSQEKKTLIAPVVKAKVANSKLKDLAWSLDINEKTNGRINTDDNINI